MNSRDERRQPSTRDGSATAAEGTPVPVDMSMGRRERAAIILFLAGPVVWGVHFMVVYMVAEAGCTGEGTGLRLFDPPVPTIVTLAATAVAALACLGIAGSSYRWWRAASSPPGRDDAGEEPGEGSYHDPGRTLAFGGFVLALLSAVTVLFVGLPAAVLPAC